MGRISALTELTSLASNDYLVVLDSSANIAKKITIANAFGIPDFGWTASGETWTYASWDSATRTGTITVPTDATTKYTKGMRIKISQSTGGTKYGLITDIASTLLTVFFPTGTTLNNETISSPSYSIGKAPLGFPTDRTLWALTFTTNTDRSIAATATTWYKVHSSHQLVVPKGSWNIRYKTAVYAQSTSAAAATKVWGALSSSASAPVELELVVPFYYYDATSNIKRLALTTSANLNVELTSSTTYHFLARTDSNGTLDVRCNADPTMIIEAVTNYL